MTNNENNNVKLFNDTPENPPQQPHKPAKKPGEGFGIASIVLGLSSMFCIGGLIAAILAIVFGCIAKSKGDDSYSPTVGVILGIVSTCLFAFYMFR